MQEPRDEDGGVGPVKLLTTEVLAGRSDAEAAAYLVVQDGGKHTRESKRGTHSQSMDPFIPTSAAVRKLPMTP